MSSGDSGRVDVLLAAHDNGEDFAGDVALQGTDRFLPASRNLTTPDPRCAPLNYLIEPKQTQGVTTIMNNNFAFGGLNTSLILRKLD